MMHVAPCSCDLHVRIRELETAYAAEQKAWGIAETKRRELEAELAHWKTQYEFSDATALALNVRLSAKERHCQELADRPGRRDSGGGSKSGREPESVGRTGTTESAAFPPEGIIREWKARAEKAERRLMDAYATAPAEIPKHILTKLDSRKQLTRAEEGILLESAKRWQARVAELTAEVQAFADADYDEPIGHFLERRRVLALKIAKIAKEPLDAEQERLHAREDE